MGKQDRAGGKNKTNDAWISVKPTIPEAPDLYALFYVCIHDYANFIYSATASFVKYTSFPYTGSSQTHNSSWPPTKVPPCSVRGGGCVEGRGEGGKICIQV